VAFGTLDSVVVVQIAPTPLEIRKFPRPPYVEKGTVPYIDWGSGLTPTYRDSVYTILAIAWGKTLQLAIYMDIEEEGDPGERLIFDGFYVCDEKIDSLYFMSESILFVLINKKEVRVLYTQNFAPGIVDEEVFLKDMQRKGRSFEQIQSTFSGASAYAEKNKGYRLIPEV